MTNKKRLIDANTADVEEISCYYGNNCYIEDVQSWLDEQPTVEAKEIKHGYWQLEPHWFYRDTFDDSIELTIYITASCSQCGRKHPDRYEVFGKTLYGPEDADYGWRFDEEKETQNVIDKYMHKGYEFARYCPDCGAMMAGGKFSEQ